MKPRILPIPKLSIKIILLAGLKPKNIDTVIESGQYLSIKIILLAGLKQLDKFLETTNPPRLSIKIILLAGLKQEYSNHGIHNTEPFQLK